ncbi:MAG: energy transducer TonB [Acidobacteriaceae bacterium]|nr:energy transducer TonB [Acidobacteriaceae bacterium]
MAQLKALIVAPAPPVAAPPQAKEVTNSVPSRPLVRKFLPHLTAPHVIPNRVNTVIDTPIPPDIGIPGAVDQSVTGNALGPNIIGSMPDGAPPPQVTATPKPKASSSPVRVGIGVAEANLIHRVQPVYPPLAKAARVQGVVEFRAIITKTGNIENLQLVRGYPLLVEAARQAVLQWKYRPTLLNGEPVEVVTDIIVNFTLTQ